VKNYLAAAPEGGSGRLGRVDMLLAQRRVELQRSTFGLGRGMGECECAREYTEIQ